jgi:hypothetical protein
MDRFRLFRSRAFWFGVPGLVGLMWGWWVSMGYRSYVMAASDVAELLFGQIDGEVVLVRGSGPLPPLDDWVWVHDELVPGMAEGIKREEQALDDAGISRAVFIPYYWLVLAYLAGWAGLMLWRSWKYRSLLPESRKEG